MMGLTEALTVGYDRKSNIQEDSKAWGLKFYGPWIALKKVPVNIQRWERGDVLTWGDRGGHWDYMVGLELDNEELHLLKAKKKGQKFQADEM